MMTRRQMLLVAPAAAALLVTGGLLAGPVRSWAADGGDDPSISRARAEELAVAQYPDARVHESELDREAGVLVYDIELSNGYDVEIDATTGEVRFAALDHDDDDRYDDDDDDRYDDDRTNAGTVTGTGTGTGTASGATPVAEPTITRDEAERIALEQHPDAQVRELSLDREHGRLIYEIDLSNGWDLDIDAQDGTILHAERD